MTTIETSPNEEENLTHKIYKNDAIRGGTFLGGPLVAGYFIAENYKAFNEHDKVKTTWLLAILATIVVFSVAFLLPDTIKVPRIALPLIYSWIAYYIVKKYQGDQIDEHLGSGGLAYSWWRVIAISLIGVIVTLIPVFILAMIIMR